MYDLVIKNSTIIDGSKNPSYSTDIGILNDKIVKIGPIDINSSKSIIDGTSLTTSPGFIDVHNHSDGWLLKDSFFDKKISQGFTTEVLMSDGISYAPVNKNTINEWLYYLKPLNGLDPTDYKGWESIKDYFKLLDKNCLQNTVAQIPYANIRSIVHGWGSAFPSEDNLKQIKKEIEKGMIEGAVGLSTGLEYVNECYASTKELISACSALEKHKGLHITHIRYPLGIVEGLKEAVEISQKSNTPLHVSHLKGPNKEISENILNYINQIAVNEVDFSFDVYPYISASTMLHYLLPFEIWEDGPIKAQEKIFDPKIQNEFQNNIKNENFDKICLAWVPEGKFKSYQGSKLSSYIKDTGLEPTRALSNLLALTNFAVLLVFMRDNDELVHPFLCHEKCMLGTDGIYFPNSPVHPRMYGSIGRILGTYSRDHKLFSLEEAIYKVSTFAAQKFGLKNRGFIKENYFADLTIFDHKKIREENSHTKGIKTVIVNGKIAYTEDKPQLFEANNFPGRFIEYNKL